VPARRTRRCDCCAARGTERKRRSRPHSASRTIAQEWVTQNEVENDADGIRNKDRQQHPQDNAHATTSRISGDVPDEENEDKEADANQQSDKKKRKRKRFEPDRRPFALNKKYGAIDPEQYWKPEEREQHGSNPGASRNNFHLFA
jgi:hypothetical protein